MKWKRRGSKTAEKRSGRPKTNSKRSRRTLKKIVKQNHKSSLVEITQGLKSSSGVSASCRTVRRELTMLGSHGRADAQKPKIIRQNKKRRLQRCKAHRHWTTDVEKYSFQ